MLSLCSFQHLNKTFNADVPLVLMNSFNTDEDTKKILQKYKHHRVNIHTFNQSRYNMNFQISTFFLSLNCYKDGTFSFSQVSEDQQGVPASDRQKHGDERR